MAEMSVEELDAAIAEIESEWAGDTDTSQVTDVMVEVPVLKALIRRSRGVEQAFRAGWLVNADTTHHGHTYLKGCEDADWKAYAAGNMQLIANDPPPLPPLMLFNDETGKLFGHVQHLLGVKVRLTNMSSGMKAINSIEGGGQRVVLAYRPVVIACELEELAQCIVTEARAHENWDALAADMDWALVVGLHEVIQWTREGWSVGLAVAVDRSRKERINGTHGRREGERGDTEADTPPAQDHQDRGNDDTEPHDQQDGGGGPDVPDHGTSGTEG